MKKGWSSDAALNEVRRLLREYIGEEIPGFAAVGDDLAVLINAVIVELLFVELAVPLVPAGRDVGRVAGGVTD